MLLVTLATIGLSVYLYIIVPKGFFPQQDTGRLIGRFRPTRTSRSRRCGSGSKQFVEIVGEDPAVENVVAFTGGGRGGLDATPAAC